MGDPQCLCRIPALSNFKAKARYQFAEVHHYLFICIDENIFRTSRSNWVEIQKSN